MTVPGRLLALPILAYRYLLSPLIPPSCRYHPSCSDYALGALGRFGAAGGVWLIVLRLARCHPWGGCGEDPVPDRLPGPPWRRRVQAPHGRTTSDRPATAQSGLRP
jgi:putative membrane protein insertion efficiency factor